MTATAAAAHPQTDAVLPSGWAIYRYQMETTVEAAVEAVIESLIEAK